MHLTMPLPESANRFAIGMTTAYLCLPAFPSMHACMLYMHAHLIQWYGKVIIIIDDDNCHMLHYNNNDYYY